jgi:hypothetical protein
MQQMNCTCALTAKPMESMFRANFRAPQERHFEAVERLKLGGSDGYILCRLREQRQRRR